MIYCYYAVISTTVVTTVDVTIYTTYKLPAYYVFIYIRRRCSSSILNIPLTLLCSSTTSTINNNMCSVGKCENQVIVCL